MIKFQTNYLFRIFMYPPQTGARCIQLSGCPSICPCVCKCAYICLCVRPSVNLCIFWM